MKKTILVTGCRGFIGSAFIHRYYEKYTFVGVDIVSSVKDGLCDAEYSADICDYEAMKEIFSNHKIDIVLHTAAEKSLVKCEEEKERAFAINYTGTIGLLSLAEQYRSKFVFISSDQVFDGTKALYSEASLVNAINYYGRLKILAEQRLLSYPNAAICRTALVFGNIPAEQMDYFNQIKHRDTLSVQGYIVQHTKYRLEHNLRIILPDDEFVSPTHVLLLADQLDHVISRNVSGILHCCGKGRISRYDMGVCIAEHYNLDKIDILRSGYPDLLRPKDVSMDCTYTENKLGMCFMTFPEMLDAYMKET